MKNIFKIPIIVIIIGISIESFAQISPKSKDELIRYYHSNIDKLDPIEGVYIVEILKWGENAYRRFPAERQSLMLMIYKDLSENFKFYGVENGTNIMTIKNLGVTSLYEFNIFWKGSGEESYWCFVLENNSLFDLEFSIPDKQLRHDLGRDYQSGFKVHFIYSFVKKYPNKDIL